MPEGIFIFVILLAALAKTVWELSFLPGGVVSVLIIAATTVFVIYVLKPTFQQGKKIFGNEPEFSLGEVIDEDYSVLTKFSEGGKYDFVCLSADYNLCYIEPASATFDGCGKDDTIFHATFKFQFTSHGRSYCAKKNSNGNFWKVNYCIITFYFKEIEDDNLPIYIAASSLDYYDYDGELISGLPKFRRSKSELVFEKIDKKSPGYEMYKKACECVFTPSNGWRPV